jgi:hypothetical protein
MANKALSDCVKRQEQSQNKEDTMAKAVEACSAEQVKCSSWKGAQKIAQEYGIANQWRTIVNRYDGGRSIHDTHKDQQKLTSMEEAVIVDFINQSADCGFPQTC